MRELGIRDGSITELERDKARAVTELELERIKVRVLFLMTDISGVKGGRAPEARAFLEIIIVYCAPPLCSLGAYIYI